MASMTSIAEAVRALEGMRLTEVRRVANMAIVVVRADGGAGWTIHAQCPFRVMHGDVILLGSRDLNWARDRGTDRDEAFETGATKYDSQAEFLTSQFAAGDFRVTGTAFGPGGLLVVEAANDGDPARSLPGLLGTVDRELAPVRARGGCRAFRVPGSGRPRLRAGQAAGRD
jgi:hypothetical protein